MFKLYLVYMMRSPTTYTFLLLGIFISTLLGCADNSIGNLIEEGLSPDRNLNANYGLDNNLNWNASSGCLAITEGHWPKDIPVSLCYPGSELLTAKHLFGSGVEPVSLDVSKNDGFSELVLSSGDTFQADWQVFHASPKLVYEFYRDFFNRNEWSITRQPNELSNAGLFQGIKGGARITIRFEDALFAQQIADSLQDSSSLTGASPSTTNPPLIGVERVDSEQLTRYTLSYRPQPIIGLSESVALEAGEELDPLEERVDAADAKFLEGEEQLQEQLEELEEEKSDDESISGVDGTEGETLSRDIRQAPEDLQSYVEDIVALSDAQELIRTAINGTATFDEKEVLSSFSPNVPITRREYARWLFTLNNVLRDDRPSKQIYLGNETGQPAFQDVLPTDPDFSVIQGLAEAGLIASLLTDEEVNTLFQPDVPMTRELLVAWKTPLDVGVMSTATVEDLRLTWGFQDLEQIDSQNISAIVADYQSGDRSNIRRAFGYTLLFQPQKVVTRAEAAAVLWHFGNEDDGVSIRDRL